MRKAPTMLLNLKTRSQITGITFESLLYFSYTNVCVLLLGINMYVNKTISYITKASCFKRIDNHNDKKRSYYMLQIVRSFNDDNHVTLLTRQLRVNSVSIISRNGRTSKSRLSVSAFDYYSQRLWMSNMSNDIMWTTTDREMWTSLLPEVFRACVKVTYRHT